MENNTTTDLMNKLSPWCKIRVKTCANAALMLAKLSKVPKYEHIHSVSALSSQTENLN